MATQTFDTIDVARLEIERDPEAGEYLNLVTNPNGERGAWGWVANEGLVATTTWPPTRGGETEPCLAFRPIPDVDNWFETERLLLPETAAYCASSWDALPESSDAYLAAELLFFDGNGDYLARAGMTPWTVNAEAQPGPFAAVPVGAVYVTLRVYLARNTDGDWTDIFGIYEVCVRNAAVLAYDTDPRPTLATTTRTNLVPNSGAVDDNAAGWVAQGGTVDRVSSVGPSLNSPEDLGNTACFRLLKTSVDAYVFINVPVTAGTTYTASMATRISSAGGAIDVAAQIVWRDAADAIIGATVTGPVENVETNWQTNGINRPFVSAVAPVGAVSADVRLRYRNSTGSLLFDAVLFEEGTARNRYYPGTAERITGTLPASNSTYWRDVTPDLLSVGTNRIGGEVGTLTAQIKSAALDPIADPTALRPGRKVRLSAYVAGTWEPLFTGRLDPEQAAYITYRLHREELVPVATINAVDAFAVVAGAASLGGVRRIEFMPAVFEGLGVPWNCNGDTGQIPFYPSGSQAFELDGTVLDNLLITRDTTLGFVWADRHGVVNVFDRPTMPTVDHSTDDPGLPALTDALYNAGIVVDYDTAVLVNSVTLVVDDGGVITEHGPFEDARSIATWGRRPAKYTLSPEGFFAPSVYAADVLNLNTQPAVDVRSVVFPVHSVERLDRTVLDLYHVLPVQNTLFAYDEALRVTSIAHTITPDKWLMSIGFGRPDRAPIPTIGGAS